MLSRIRNVSRFFWHASPGGTCLTTRCFWCTRLEGNRTKGDAVKWVRKDDSIRMTNSQDGLQQLQTSSSVYPVHIQASFQAWRSTESILSNNSELQFDLSADSISRFFNTNFSKRLATEREVEWKDASLFKVERSKGAQKQTSKLRKRIVVGIYTSSSSLTDGSDSVRCRHQ